MSATVFWFVVLSIGIAVLIWAAKRPSEAEVRGWADARDVPVTNRNAGLLSDFLRRTRLLRTIGGVGGLLLSQAPAALYGAMPDSPILRWLVDSPIANALVMLVIGYLVGALVAEYTRPRRAEGSGQRAALVPREWADYVDQLSRWVLRGSVVVSIALAPLGVVVPVVPDPRMTTSPSRFVLEALAVVTIVVSVEWVQRLIVHRPQPFADPELVAADDAMLASSVHAVAGVGLLLVLFLVGTQMSDIGTGTSVRPLRWTLPFMGGALQIVGLGLWLAYGTHFVWVVRRRLVHA